MDALQELLANSDQIVKESLSGKRRVRSDTMTEIVDSYSKIKGREFAKLCDVMEKAILEIDDDDELTELCRVYTNVLKILSPKRPEDELTPLRNWARENLQDEQLKIVLKTVNLTRDEWKTVIKTSMSQREALNEKQLEIEMSDVMYLVDETKDSTDWRDMYILMMLCTGRRSVEIIVGGFETVDDDDHFLSFTGRVKQAKGVEDTPMLIPTLFLTPEEIVDKLIAIRKVVDPMVEGKTKADIHASIGRSVETRLKKINSEWSSHVCRKIYITLCYRNYKSTGSLNHYIKVYLGHQGLDTSLNYANVSMVFDVPDESRIGGNEKKSSKNKYE